MLTKKSLLTACLALAVGVTAACSSSGDTGGGSSTGAGGGAGDTINVWTADTLPDRVAATKKIFADFTAKTGIKVQFTGVAGDQFNQVLTSSAAAGTLPDVWGSLPLDQVRTLSGNDLVDPDANAAVIRALGAGTFSARALELTKDGDKQVGVPSDSWAQVLIYRKDLFDKAGLAAPKTLDDVTAAAKALNSPPTMVGFVGATKAGDLFTEQTFENVALANGCQLVDKDGKILIDSPPCVKAFSLYGDLINKYSVAGNQDVNSVRAAYFAGKSAMFIWSTFVLDEMAGLRNNAKPSCPECVADPGFLAKNSGVVSTLQGPDGKEPAQYGSINSWTILKGDHVAAAKTFVDYMFNDGMTPWIAFAPEGKVPVRKGTQAAPTKFIDEWKTLPVGVDTKAPLSKFYGDDVLKILSAGPDAFSVWGIPQGQGKLMGALAGQLPVAAAVSEVTNGKADPAAAAKKAADTIKSIQSSIK